MTQDAYPPQYTPHTAADWRVEEKILAAHLAKFLPPPAKQPRKPRRRPLRERSAELIPLMVNEESRFCD
jgi:hypothetical protein